jgi:uncharacterized protein
VEDTRLTISDEELLGLYPEVRLNHDNKDFYKGLTQRRYLVNRCDDCGTWHTPARYLCPACWSRAVLPTPVSGRGKVAMYTVLHQGPAILGKDLPGDIRVDYAVGYVLAGIELEEQSFLRVSGRIVDTEPAAVAIGMPVELGWVDGDGGVPVPIFRPTTTGRTEVLGNGQ